MLMFSKLKNMNPVIESISSNIDAEKEIDVTEEYNNRHLLFQWPKEKEENNT